MTENQKIQPSHRWQRNQIGGRKSIPQCPILPIEQIKLNSKPNTEHTERNTENTERQRFLSKKKKKIPNTQIKTKPGTPANPRSRRHDATARSSSSSSLAPHRRSEIGLCSGAPSGPPSRYFSLFLSLFISLSLK